MAHFKDFMTKEIYERYSCMKDSMQGNAPMEECEKFILPRIMDFMLALREEGRLVEVRGGEHLTMSFSHQWNAFVSGVVDFAPGTEERERGWTHSDDPTFNYFRMDGVCEQGLTMLSRATFRLSGNADYATVCAVLDAGNLPYFNQMVAHRCQQNQIPVRLETKNWESEFLVPIYNSHSQMELSTTKNTPIPEVENSLKR